MFVLKIVAASDCQRKFKILLKLNKWKSSNDEFVHHQRNLGTKCFHTLEAISVEYQCFSFFLVSPALSLEPKYILGISLFSFWNLHRIVLDLYICFLPLCHSIYFLYDILFVYFYIWHSFCLIVYVCLFLPLSNRFPDSFLCFAVPITSGFCPISLYLIFKGKIFIYAWPTYRKYLTAIVHESKKGRQFSQLRYFKRCSVFQRMIIS